MSSSKFVIRPEDFLVNDLFEDSNCFLELAKEHEGKDTVTARRYVRASIVTAYVALEALVNTLLVYLKDTEDLGLHERRGRRFTSLEQKIGFLYSRSEGKPIPKRSTVWRALLNATDLRKKLVHPRPGQVPYSSLTTGTAKSWLMAAVELSEKVGGRALISQVNWGKLTGLKLNDASGSGN
jgi:hypothetical protein